MWKLLYIVGATMAVVALYLLHDEIWPGEGFFLNTFFEGAARRAARRAARERSPGDFSGVGTFAFFVRYYLPAAVGILMCVVGRWLQVTERVPRHVLYDEMGDDDQGE